MPGFTPITPALGWQDPTYVNEILAAWRERQAVSGFGTATFADRVAGDSAQDDRIVKSWPEIDDADWWWLQFWVETYCVGWCDNTTDDYTGRTFPGACAPVWTLATFRVAAWGVGAGAKGFRRVTGAWPADWTDYADAAYSYGLAQPGDKIGPWLLADLQAALARLVWLPSNAAGGYVEVLGEAGGGNNHRWTDGAPRSTYALATAWADTDYAANADATATDPGAYSYVALGGGNYQAHLERRMVYGHWTSHDELSKEIDFYVGAAKIAGAGNTFDAQGDGVAASQWTFWRTESVSGDDGLTGAAFGSLTKPTYSGSVGDYFGYYGDLRAVFRYDVAGGFSYY